jgi:hypothetical protein
LTSRKEKAGHVFGHVRGFFSSNWQAQACSCEILFLRDEGRKLGLKQIWARAWARKTSVIWEVMMFPILSTRKADTISTGVFLILLGFIFYTGQWWPGILFALGFSFALRQFLTNRLMTLLITVILIGILALMTWAGQAFSIIFPLLFIIVGLILIAKECLTLKGSPFGKSPPDSEDKKE